VPRRTAQLPRQRFTREGALVGLWGHPPPLQGRRPPPGESSGLSASPLAPPAMSIWPISGAKRVQRLRGALHRRGSWDRTTRLGTGVARVEMAVRAILHRHADAQQRTEVHVVGADADE
jgi:hypothetical protein